MRRSQKQAILDLLTSFRGDWVPLPKIIFARGASTIIAQYNKRIEELRAEGHKIENRQENDHGQIYSWYRLVG